MRLAAQRENRKGHRIGFSLEQVDMIIQALQIKRYGQDASCPYLSGVPLGRFSIPNRLAAWLLYFP